MKTAISHNTTDIINILKSNKPLYHTRNNITIHVKGIRHGTGPIQIVPFVNPIPFELLPSDELFYNSD